MRVKVDSHPELQFDPKLLSLAHCGTTAPLDRKASGAYFTPDHVVSTLLRWAVRSPADRMLDPSCGDGRILAGHQNSVGVEQDHASAWIAKQRAPWADVHGSDFFAWASVTADRFDCSAGNPPFVRYQTFKGPVRDQALALCQSQGVRFSGLSSSWAPFLVATAGLLKAGGRMAFVVPAEIGHAPYAAPLLEYFIKHFALVHLVAIRRKLFPELSEDCWLLYADGFGGQAAAITFTAVDAFVPERWQQPPQAGISIAVDEWRTVWKRRLRPFLLPGAVRDAYKHVGGMAGARRLGEVARIGIGYVSGDNDFFHLRPSQAILWDIPPALLQPTVRNGRALPERHLKRSNVDAWRENDDPVMLLRLGATTVFPERVQRYLDCGAGLRARETFKCRTRNPWYCVPDVRIPDYFLTYMSGCSANLVRNDAGATCTNSVHGLTILDKLGMQSAVRQWDSDFVALSREIEGHPLGGGMLKLEVREASEIVLPPDNATAGSTTWALAEAVDTMRRWRHHG